MRLDDLEKYGIPSKLLDIWRKRQGEVLLPVQDRAIRQGLLERFDKPVRPSNMIICAPTSAGKSFCAELAAIKALMSRQKAVLVLPLKSLAEEQFRLFRDSYTPLGIKCIIATGDHPENDAPFADGDYQLAVTIYEKLDLLLTNRLDALQNIGLIAVDEIQMISEPGRGAIVERLLTKILASTYEPVLLALSAVLGDRAVEPLAEWLDASLVEETVRPRDLIRGVAAEGVLRFRSHNDGHDGSESFTCFEPGRPEALEALAKQLKKDGDSTLMFVKSRSDTVNLALKLAAQMPWPPAKKALAQLADEEQSFLLRSLTQALSHGVAFHNSDLSGFQRNVVEHAFAAREVMVLCSTTTLALGVNLPADTVYLETVKYSSGTYDSHPELVPITRAEFDNMAGRAGRQGLAADSHSAEPPGRAIVMAGSNFDQDILWGSYIAPMSAPPVGSAFSSLPLEDWVLHLVTASLATNEDELRRVLASTYRSRLENKDVAGLEDALVFLEQAGFVRGFVSDGQLTATSLGAAVARAGLSAREATHFRRLIGDRSYPETAFGWTALALSSPNWPLQPAVLTRYEQLNNLPVRMLYQRFDHSVEEAAYLLPDYHRREPLPYRIAVSLKSALLLDEWRRLVPVRKLEERFQMHLGQIQSLGETAAHLVSALSALIAASDHESTLPRVLSEHTFSLRFGMPPSFETMHRHLGTVLNRSDFHALFQAGIESLEALADLTSENLRNTIKGNDKAINIIEILERLKQEVEMQTPTVSDRSGLTGMLNLIEIDGTYEQDRYLIRINGFPVRLTGKSFKYLTKLAWSRLHGDGGWLYKEDIEVGFNQARYLYRLKNEISAGFGRSWPLVENNRLGYYRLNVEPGKIRLNEQNLKNHPDYEVRSLFGPEAEAGMVS